MFKEDAKKKKKNVFPPTNIMGRYLGRKKCYVLIKLVRDSMTESLDCEFQNRSLALIPPLLSERKPEESRDCLTVLSTIRSGLENSFSLRDGLSYRERTECFEYMSVSPCLLHKA